MERNFRRRIPTECARHAIDDSSNISASLLLAALAIFCQFTLHVRRIPPAAPTGMVWPTTSIRAFDGVQLDGWFVRSKVPNGNCVIVLHGIGDSRHGSAGYAAIFLDQGYSVRSPIAEGTARAEANWSLTDFGRNTMSSTGRIG